MASRLKALFDRCPWKGKHQGPFPDNPDEIAYQWTEADADYAEAFFTDAAMKVYTEETNVVRRSLHLSEDGNGRSVLCIREVEKPEYRDGIKDMAKAYVTLFDPEKTENYLRDKLDLGDKK